MQHFADYNSRQDGTLPSERTLSLLTSPAALRARAAIRLEIARQDTEIGDTHAVWRNRGVAAAMIEDAEKGAV